MALMGSVWPICAVVENLPHACDVIQQRRVAQVGQALFHLGMGGQHLLDGLDRPLGQAEALGRLRLGGDRHGASAAKAGAVIVMETFTSLLVTNRLPGRRVPFLLLLARGKPSSRPCQSS